MIKMFIDNEEVVSDREFTINEEMLSASSTILNNCYPKSWELDRDYISNFYYPKDYSKFLLGEGEFEKGDTEYSVLEATCKNLFNINGISIINGYVNYNTGVFTAPTGNNQKCFYIKIKPNEIYTWSGYNTTSTLGYGLFTEIPVATNNANSWGQISASKTITTGANDNYLVMFYTAVNATVDLMNFQLELGSTATSYEEYGGGFSYNTNIEKVWNNFNIYGNTYQETSENPVMPSPNYPSELVSVGYKNMLNPNLPVSSETNRGITVVNNHDGTWHIFGTATSTLGIKLTSPNVIELEKGKSYIHQLEILEGTFNGTITVSVKNDGGTISYNYLNVYSTLLYNVKTPTEHYIISGLNYYAPTGTQVDAVVRLSLYQSNQILGYVPYDKYGLYIRNNGKNLMKITTVSGVYNELTFTKIDDNTFRVQGTTGVSNRSIPISYNLFPINEGEKYTYSAEVLEGSFVGTLPISIYNTDNSIRYDYFRLSSSTLSQTNTIVANNGINGISYFIGAHTTVDVTLRVMFEKSPQKTVFEPYKENSHLYVLNEPLRRIGDICDKLVVNNGALFVERRIGVKVLNGTESWYQWGTNLYYIINLTKTRNSLSDHFKFVDTTSSGALKNGEYMIHTAQNNYAVIFKYTGVNSLNDFKTWLSSNNVDIQYVLETSNYEALGYLGIPNSYVGDNNVILETGLRTQLEAYYYWKNFNVLFAGIVKNSGDISLNPRHPHYCSLQILDYKTFLSESNTLDFVIANKTVSEAINMVVNAISGYGFVVGEINISGADDVIGAYSTLNKTAYDVLQYLAEISGSRWRARYVDSSTMAIDFYDPDTLPQASDIEYTNEYWENNNVVDMSFNYGTRDYRNKQILLSDEVYANINYDETVISNGYSNTFTLQNNVGVLINVLVDNEEKSIATINDKQMGIDADFYYTPGKNVIESNSVYSAGTMIHLTYQPLVKGRQIVYNTSEVERISMQTDTEGVIARYENRNDILSSDELEKIAQTYIEYKGKAEVILTLKTQNKDLYNVGEVVYFDAPIDELKQNYMVKNKKIEYVIIKEIINLFYVYELTSSFNSEKAINYFDNQRNKASGNIAEGESITRNVDIETGVSIIWSGGTVSSASITVDGNNVLNSALNSPFIE